VGTFVERDLAFVCHADTPVPQFEVGRDNASLSIRPDHSAEPTVLLAATKSGNRLHVHERERGTSLRDWAWDLSHRSSPHLRNSLG
jgi:hypothetical protein